MSCWFLVSDRSFKGSYGTWSGHNRRCAGTLGLWRLCRWKDIYIQQSTLGHTRETHRHHEGRERKKGIVFKQSNFFFTFPLHCNNVRWFFYFISCHSHVCHHFGLQDANDDEHAKKKQKHPDRVTQTSPWMLNVIVLAHKCEFLTAARSRHNLIATHVSCIIQFFCFSFIVSKLPPQAVFNWVFSLWRKECNDVIFTR